jgi:eukaryotic-like serine/threonine-protein kinase
MALKPGDTLFNGQYRVLRLLGRGGFGFVYEAEDTLLAEKVAVKEMIPALVGDEVMLKRFLTEAKATMRLRHKRIVATHNLFSEGDNYYIVMELMPGGSLEASLQERGVLPVDEAVRIAADACEGLACAHEEGVVHCDLKPANILLDKKGRAKVADFGIAHISEQALTRSWHTPSGFVAGTLPYMSPEQVDGVRDDPRVDVYAMGALLYRMLTGRTYLDFDERETPRAQVENVQRICGQDPKPPSAHNRHVPPWLDQVTLKALAKRPEARFATAQEMHTELLHSSEPVMAKAQSAAAQPGSIVGPSPPKQPRLAKSAIWALAVGSGILLLSIAVGFLVLRGSGGAGTALTATTARTGGVAQPPESPAASLNPTNNELPVPTARNGQTPERPTSTFGPLPTTTPPLAPPPATRPTLLPSATPSGPAPTMSAPAPSLIQLTHSRYQEYAPSYSPDGGKIVYMSDQDGPWQIYVMDALGGGAQRLTSNNVDNYHPRFSPDGQRIVFASTMDGDWDLYLMDLEMNIRQLIDEPGDQYYPHFAPDGLSISFMGKDNGQWDIFLVDVTGGSIRHLTNHPADDVYPTIAPDGRSIVFQSNRDGNWEIYVLDNGTTRRLTNHPSRDANPSVSPDGRWILFESNRDGRNAIYVMDWNGSQVKRLTTDSADSWVPSFTPDGRAILFQSNRSGNMDLYTLLFEP